MTEASETIARQVRNAVRETVSARRIQGSAGGGWTETAIDEILFRGSHDIMRPLASYPSSVVHALMPSVVLFMLQLSPRDGCDRGAGERTGPACEPAGHNSAPSRSRGALEGSIQARELLHKLFATRSAGHLRP